MRLAEEDRNVCLGSCVKVKQVVVGWAERCVLTTSTDVLTTSETLCRSSAAVPGFPSPRVNLLVSGCTGVDMVAHTFASMTIKSTWLLLPSPCNNNNYKKKIKKISSQQKFFRPGPRAVSPRSLRAP